MNRIKLYYAPPSFYSQIARLVLAEASIEYDEEIVAPGPPRYSTYAPEYMSLNANGTVPTLVIGDEVLDDSRKIVDWIAEKHSDTLLIPKDDSDLSQMYEWIDRAYRLSERELAYGTGLIKTIGAFVNKKRLKKLEHFKARNPDMAALYKHKISDIKDFIAKSSDPRHVAALARKYDGEMSSLDKLLAENRYICGEPYSLADVCWTVTIARQILLKRHPLATRPNLARWFEEMKTRPSYESASILDHFSFAPMYKMLKGEFSKKPQ